MTAPYAPGDTIRVLHTCAGHGPDVFTFTVERVTALTSGTFRVTTTRCDGTQMDVEVDTQGRDYDDGDVLP